MRLETLVQLAETGNTKEVEGEWMLILEREDAPDALIEHTAVLEGLAKRDRLADAESLAWTAIEAMSEQRSLEDALQVAKRFLLKLNNSKDLRSQVAELYRRVYADRDGIEALVETSGIAGGRPPRRALRTLDVCLGLENGTYAAARHEEGVVRVTSISTSDWEITVSTGRSKTTLGPMEFADEYAPCAEDDVRVLSRFDPDRLAKLIAKEPATVVTNVLKHRGEPIDSDGLKQEFCPSIVAPSDWTKWWSRARTALKKSPHVRIEGRSPYILSYNPDGSGIEEDFEKRFKKTASPADQLALVEQYARECELMHQPPDAAILKRVGGVASKHASRTETRDPTAAFCERLLEWQIGVAAGDESADDALIRLIQRHPDPIQCLRTCENATMWRYGIEVICKALPDRWVEFGVAAFPFSPAAICEYLDESLGEGPDANWRDRTVETILADSLNCFEALVWLWDKGAAKEPWKSAAPMTILTRMIRLMGEISKSDMLPRETERRIRTAIRSALSARKYERFLDCIQDIDPGMASALFTDIGRLDNLGRNAREDLLNRIRNKYPKLHVKAEKARWEMEDVLYSTEGGIARWQAAINELVNVKMRENAIAIGTAAEKGDLSENSEYKFALEERDLLRSRLANMQSQLALASPIGPEQVTTEHVTIGSKVTLRHCGTGTERQITFLGPFDADSEKGILNYKAPLSQELMGLRMGDRIELAHFDPCGTYEIADISVWE